jgi:transcriptional regulator with XRE-family HTH domain
MTPLLELGHAVRARRSDMGLSQAALARLSGLSRATVNQLETGTIKDLSLTRAARLLGVLGLAVNIASPHPRLELTASPGAPGTLAGPARSAPIDIAARTASTSYPEALSGEQLRQALLTGHVDADRQPHLRALLDEAPLGLLAAVVEQLHRQQGVPRAEVWHCMGEIARRLHTGREIWRV